MHKTFAMILLSFVASTMGCNRNRVTSSSIEGQIGHAIEERCPKGSNCTVRLHDLTPFDWDKMFYFEYNVSPAEREKAVGVRLESEELRRQLVFLSGGNIVRNNLLPTDVERPIENEIVFKVGKDTDWITCDNQAQFTATRDDGGTGIMFFQLKSTSGHCR